MKIICLFLFTVYFSGDIAAQQYPVQVIPQLLPPYSLHLTDYYNGNTEKLVLVMTNTDLRKPSLDVRLHMSIIGQLAKLSNRNGVYYPAIHLDAGIPLRLSLNDLAPYFNADNLDFQGITRSQYAQNSTLPEGFYQFCFEAIEVNSGQVVGRSSCAMAWISLNDPPLLNLPLKSESIASKDPQNIIFQWTPRNFNSPTSAFNTEYEFTIVEIWDNGLAPEAAFNSSQPLYQTISTASTLLYGPSQPLLLPGHRYAWRVRAQAANSVGNSDAFRNNGYSEIWWFTCQNNCPAPSNTQSEINGGRATISWTSNPNQSSYEVDYREKNQAGGQWYSINTVNSSSMLYSLKKDKMYEYRVGGSCDNNQSFVFSDIKTFTINNTNTVDSSCGKIGPSVKITNQTPINTLFTNDIIMAGDYPVKLLQVGGQGRFTGAGYVTIPFLGQAKVKVRFTDIVVNTDRQLVQGVIETTYDPKETQIANVSDVVSGFGDLASIVIQLVKLNIDEDYQKWQTLYDTVKARVAEELPDALQEQAQTALQTLNQAKEDYDGAKTLYDTVFNSVDKAAAKKKMDDAQQHYSQAQQQLQDVMNKKDEMIKGVADIILKAVKRIKDENKSGLTDIDKYNNDLNQLSKSVFDNGDTSSGAIADHSVLIEDIDDEDAAVNEDEKGEFIRKVADLRVRRSKIKKALVHKIFTEFFSDAGILQSEFAGDSTVNGKQLIDDLIKKQQNKEADSVMSQYAYEYLIKVLDIYIESLDK